MIIQTKIAINTLTEIFGNPSWIGSLKEKETISEWDNLFKDYTSEQVKTACLRYAKFKKDGKFPSLTCIEAELVDEKKEAEDNLDKVALANKCYIYAMEHRTECDPVPTELTIQQTIWRSYGVSVGGYDPKRDGELK